MQATNIVYGLSRTPHCQIITNVGSGFMMHVAHIMQSQQNHLRRVEILLVRMRLLNIKGTHDRSAQIWLDKTFVFIHKGLFR